MRQRIVEMQKSQMLRQNRPIPVAGNRSQNQRDMRGNGGKRHRKERQRGKNLPESARGNGGRGGVSLDCGSGSARSQGKAGQQVHDQRQPQHHDNQRVRQRIRLQLRNPVEHLHCRCTRVAEHQRRPEFRETPDQDNTPSGENPRFQKRNRNPAQPVPASGAQSLRRLVHRRVNISERRHQIQVKDRIQMQGLNETDRPETAVPAEKVDPLQPEIHKNRIDYAIVSENLHEPERTDERRQDHRKHHCKIADALPRKVQLVINQGKRQRDQKHKKGRYDCQQKRIQQSFHVKGIAEDFADQVPAEPLLHHSVNRQKQENREEHDDQSNGQQFQKSRIHLIFPPSQETPLSNTAAAPPRSTSGRLPRHPRRNVCRKSEATPRRLPPHDRQTAAG